MSSFLQEIEASLPNGLVLPGGFREMFGWMQSNGFVHAGARGRYASLYPFAEDPEGCRLSLVTFRPVDADGVSRWAQDDAKAAAGSRRSSGPAARGPMRRSGSTTKAAGVSSTSAPGRARPCCAR